MSSNLFLNFAYILIDCETGKIVKGANTENELIEYAKHSVVQSVNRKRSYITAALGQTISQQVSSVTSNHVPKHQAPREIIHVGTIVDQSGGNAEEPFTMISTEPKLLNFND